MDKITDEEVKKMLDEWWHRLSKEKPLSGKESVQLQNFLYLLKGRYLSR